MKFPKDNQSFPRLLAPAFLFLAIIAGVSAQEEKKPESHSANSAAKPILLVGANGLPRGYGSPEGVAIDLATAFIYRDKRLFRETCLPPFGGGESRTAYERFLAEKEKSMEIEAGQSAPSPSGPKSIGKLFAARHLSKNGPASYGHAAFGFQDVMFVDVGVLLQNGDRLINRTLVIKAADNHWYVHPAPGIHPLLSMGLNDESPSTVDFTSVYEIKK